jgi:hypothetical protein
LKEKLHQCEETITKAAAQRTPSPMKVDMHQRNSDRKKINELENKIEELVWNEFVYLSTTSYLDS